MLEQSKNLSDQELSIIQSLMDQNEQLAEQVMKYAEIEDAARHAGADAFDELVFDIGDLDGAEEAQKMMEEFASSTDSAGKGLKDYRSVLLGTEGAENRFAKSLAESSMSQKAKDAIIKKLCQSYKTMGDAHNDGAQSMNNFKQVSEETSNVIQNGIPKITNFGVSAVNCLKGVSQLSMGINSLKSAFDTINNPDLSGFEKFLSLTTSISMGLPMLISGFQATKNAILETTLVQEILTMVTAKRSAAEVTAALVTMQNTEGDKKAVAQKALRIAAEKLGIEVAEDATNASLREAIASKLGLDTSQKLTTTKILEAAASKLNAIATGTDTVAKEGSTLATIASTIANWGWLASMSPVLAITLVIIGALAILATTIFVVVSAVQAMSAAYNKDSIAAENAMTAAKNLAESYNEIKAEYESMIQVMENYQTARDGLDSLTKGTQEYREALNEANTAALELIKLGNLVKGEDYDIEGGEIIIKDDAMDKAKEAKFNEMQDAYAASTMAQAKSSQAQAKSNQTDLVRQDDGQAVGALTATLAAEGALIGSILGPIGAAVGGLIGGVTGALTAATANASQNEADNKKIDDLTALYDQIGEAAFDSATLQEMGFNTANEAYIESVKEVVRATNQAAEQMEVAAEIAAQAVLEKNANFNNSDHQDKVSSAAGKEYQSNYEKAYEENLAKTKNNDWFGIGSKENKAAMEEYAKQTGLDQLNGYKVTNYKKGGNVEYSYIDEDGKKQTKEITQQQIAAQLAANDATKKLEEQTNTLLGTFSRLEESGNKADQALSEFAGGDLSNATKTEFDKAEQDLSQYITEDENGNRKIADDTDITQYIKDNFSEEEIAALGYDSAEEMATAFKTQFNANLEAWDKVSIPTAFDDMGIEMSLKTAQALESTFNEINLGPAGAETAEKFSTAFTEALSGLNAEDQQAALAELMTIDWSDWDAMDQAADIMEEYGITVDTTSDSWKQLTDQMRTATGAVPDFSSLKENLNAVSKILNNLDFGSVISEEDYQRLIAYNDEWERYFILQADGTRAFIGDAEAMRQQTRENIKEQQRLLEARKAAQEGFNDSDFGKTNWDTTAGSDTATAENLKNASGAVQTALEGLGYTDEVIQTMINKAKSADAKIAEEGEAQLREMYQRIGDFSKEQLNEMDASFDEMMASTAGNFAELNTLYEQGDISAEAWGKQAEVLKQNALSNAGTLSELRTAMSELEQNNVDVSQQEKADALIGLAESYSNCTVEIEKYKIALAGADEAQIASAEDALNASILIGEAAGKYGLDAEVLETQARQIKKLNPELNLSAEQAARLAVNNQRMNKGVAALNKNFKDWKKTLTTADKASMDYAEALTEVENAVGDLLGAADDFTLPDGFLDMPGAMTLIEKAAQGDELAINQLGNKISAASVEAMTFNESLANMYNEAFGANITTDTFETAKQTVLNGINDIYSNLDGLLAGTTQISDVVGTDWINAMNEMALATGMSVDQMNGLLSQLGVQAEVKTVNVPQEVEVPTYDETYVDAGTKTFTYTEIGDDGEQTTHSITRPVMRKISVPGPLVKTQGYVQVASIGTVEGGGADAPQLNFTGVGGTANNASGGNIGGGVSPSSTGGNKGGKKGGGGSTKPTKDARGKKSDYVNRYEEIEDKLDNVRDKMEKASKSADRLWGPARLKELQKVNGALLEEIDLLEEQKNEADAYLKEDKTDVQNAGKALGLNFKFDSKTNDITNIESQLEALFNKREALLDSFGAEMDEKEQETLKAFDEKVETLQDALDAYKETKELSEDLEKERQDKIYEWQDNNYEQLNYKLEYELEINDSELEKYEYYLGKIEGDIYSASEAWGYMNQTVGVYTDNLAHQEEYAKQLEEDYYAGKISMEAYKEGLKNCQSATIENLQALQEQKKAMQEYYGEVMQMAIEEITIYTDEMDNLNSVLDHYSTILDLVGKQEDYATKKKVLNSKATNLRNEMQVQKNLYEESAAQADMWAEKMANAVVGSNEYETYKKNWQAAQEAANDAQDEMLSKTEEWAETMKAVVEAEFAELAKTMEETLTGGKSFDELLTSMERRSSLQEEYLTTTNQIYETNKMMRQAQQEIDKSSNSVAKKKLQNYINETAQMQDQAKLSKYELDIQQAKYDLLLAEIALEEAQNAKSTVRLQRDSEGNFGYVYTADSEAVNNAEQNLADKQNALYNIGLEGANNYSQKYAETLQEAQDAITELTEMWMNGEIETEEEYQRRKAEIQEYYYEKLKGYSELYQVALSTDSNVIKDAWSTDFNDMMYKTEEWKGAVDTYFEGAAESMQTWTEVCSTVLEETGLDDVSKKVGEIDKKSKKLKTTLIGADGKSGVVGAMMAEVKAAGDLSSAYISIQNEIDNVITKYEKLMEELNKKYVDPNTPKVTPTPDQDKKDDDGKKDDGKKDDNNKKYDATTKRGVALAIWNGNHGWGVGKDRRTKLKEKGFDPDEMQALVNNTNPSGGWEKRYGISDLSKYAYSKFDTGGYTGDWDGPDGKFAMLHKKELVLDEKDTENFLASLSILDKIISVIDLYSTNSALGGLLSSPSLGNVGQTTSGIEQSVHIEASFPNVQDKNEIEEALNNLVNKASQYANRK